MSQSIANAHFTNAELIERRKAALPAGLPSKSGVYAERSEGAELWDVEGKRYIDFIGGIGVLNAGHRHPKVVAAIKDQADKFLHTCFGIAQYENYLDLAERLNALAPGDSPKKTALFNSGAEAVENAVKFSRHITRRPGIIAFEGAFHGRTLLASAITGKAKPYKVGFGPFPPGIFHAPYPTKGMSVQACLNCLEHIFRAEISQEDVACIIVEPVQGEGGFNPAPAEFLQGLRKICDDHGIFLIADEVQTGFARTGAMFAMEHSGVEPDFLCVAKSIAAGLPLSAVIGRADVIDKVSPGAMGSTYGGNPVAVAAALAVLDVMEEEGLVERAKEIGARAEQAFLTLKDALPNRISDVRRLGGMVAMEFSHDGDMTRPDGETAMAIVGEARNRGVITTTAGSNAQCVRTLIPLTVQDAVLDEGLAILSDAVRAVCAK